MSEFSVAAIGAGVGDDRGRDGEPCAGYRLSDQPPAPPATAASRPAVSSSAPATLSSSSTSPVVTSATPSTTQARPGEPPARTGRRWVRYSCEYPESSLMDQVTKAAVKNQAPPDGLPGPTYTALTGAFAAALIPGEDYRSPTTWPGAT